MSKSRLKIALFSPFSTGLLILFSYILYHKIEFVYILICNSLIFK